MAKVPFSKVAATPEQLLQKLKDRGLVVSAATEPMALAYLRGVGGYRLKGYWFHVVDPATKRFPAGYTFEQIAARCELDRELRAATIEAIDRLEVAIRTVMANYLSLRHSPHWFLNTAIFKPTRDWGVGQLIRKIEEEVRRAEGKRFVAHYFNRHDDPYLPPSWSISECVTFGLWSRTYAILRDAHDKKAISKRFGVDQVEVFQSWIHTLTVVRNVAAHHGQLLRVRLGVAPANYKSAGIKFADQKSFYAAATVVHFLLVQTGLPHRWKAELTAIFQRYPDVEPAELGFPAGWTTQPGW
ncbi:MAG: Abi family protein [Aquincola sp.]|nr:Abi family protein [Aquincola sp.]